MGRLIFNILYMKKILIIFIASLSACGSSKNYLERNDEDKALLDAVRKINKSADENASAAIPVLYAKIQNSHIGRIMSFQNGKDLARWDKVIAEYNSLQRAYDAIINSVAAFRLISPQNYNTQLLEAKQSAAMEYYNAGLDKLNIEGRANAKRAYSYFKKAENYIPGYKDSKSKMMEAYESAVVEVIINPVQDNSFFFNSSWGNYGYNYSNEYFQQTLVRELEYDNNSKRYPARFYTDWQARRENIQPDWVVDLRLRNIDIPQPMNYTYSRNSSANVQVGTDTAGRPRYQTVYATLNITKMSFTARAEIDVNIKDIQTGKNISYNSFRDDYRWQEERATYNGDSRALSASDWQMINTANYNTPRKEDVLNELYRKLYPQVKNNISYAVDW